MSETFSSAEKKQVGMPPLLLFGTLLFWGWQSGFLLAGGILGAILESSRIIKWRADIEDSDFRRIWSFCVLLAMAMAAYVFTTNEQGGGLSGWMHGSTVSHASISTLQTTNAVFRWLPMTLFLFIAAQFFSEREVIPVSAISLWLSWRRRQRGASAAMPEIYADISYPYFIICLFSAGIHVNEGTHDYFWGAIILIAWALWPLRSRRFGITTWLAALAVVLALGFFGQHGIGQLQRLLENYNAQWFSRFAHEKTDPSRSLTAMGQIGFLELSPRIVIRLKPISGPPPVYLREASYRNYSPARQTWYAGESLNDFSEIMHAAHDETAWDLVPGKTNTSTVQIACYLNGWSEDVSYPEGLLPLPSGCGRLENLPAVSLKINHTGAVMAVGNGLMIFDALYGTGQTFDLPPGIRIRGQRRDENLGIGTHLDLNVPTNEMPALEKVIAEIKISQTNNDPAKLLAVENFFADKFTYSSWQGRDKLADTNGTALNHFLLTSRSGHCEYFATATVLLLRALKIPARYAVGYAVHEISGDGYIVRQRDAHAWCLAWNTQTKNWEDVDTTPASWIRIEAGHASFWDRISDLQSWLGFQFAKFRWGKMQLRQYIFWALIPAMAVLLGHIIFRRRRRRERRKLASDEKISWPGLDSEFYRLTNKMGEITRPRRADESFSDWLEEIFKVPSFPDLSATLRELLHLHYRLRFDSPGLTLADKNLFHSKIQAVMKSLAKK